MERQQKAYKGVIDYFKKKIMDGISSGRKIAAGERYCRTTECES